jgi:hypothetical protein
MTSGGSQRTIPSLIEEYRQSTIAYYSACDDEKFTRQRSSGQKVNQIVQKLDAFGAEGRLALTPLLNDPDQGIRTFAAADLLKVYPERAIPVLEEISKGPTYFPRLTAGSFLESYINGKWGR